MSEFGWPHAFAASVAAICLTIVFWKAMSTLSAVDDSTTTYFKDDDEEKK